MLNNVNSSVPNKSEIVKQKLQVGNEMTNVKSLDGSTTQSSDVDSQKVGGDQNNIVDELISNKQTSEILTHEEKKELPKIVINIDKPNKRDLIDCEIISIDTIVDKLKIELKSSSQTTQGESSLLISNIDKSVAKIVNILKDKQCNTKCSFIIHELGKYKENPEGMQLLFDNLRIQSPAVKYVDLFNMMGKNHPEFIDDMQRNFIGLTYSTINTSQRLQVIMDLSEVEKQTVSQKSLLIPSLYEKDKDLVESELRMVTHYDKRVQEIVIKYSTLEEQIKSKNENTEHELTKCQKLMSTEIKKCQATKDVIYKCGMTPHQTIHIDEMDVHLSLPYIKERDGNKRIYMLACIEDKNGNTSLRTFYLSGSQGVWRSPSHYDIDKRLGKGNECGGENATNVPISLQKKLFESLGKSNPVNVNDDDAGKLIFDQLEFFQPVGSKKPPEFSSCINSIEILVDTTKTETIKSLDYEKSPILFCKPQDLDVKNWKNQDNRPDFSKTIDCYSFKSTITGTINAYVFNSVDSKIQYLFYRDESDRMSVASIQISNSKINKFGVNSDALCSGHLTMPSIEYYHQIPEGYNGKQVQGDYHDVTPYVHSLEIVKCFGEFLKEQKE